MQWVALACHKPAGVYTTHAHLFVHSASPRASLALRYSTSTTLGFGILGDLPRDEPKALLVVHAEGIFSLEAKTVAPTGSQTRVLSCPAPTHDTSLWLRLWEHLTPDSVVRLDADVSIFAALIRTTPRLGVTELSMFLDVGNDLPLLPPGTSVFPALKALRLCGPPRVAARPLASADLAEFVASLNLTQDLDTLVLKSIALSGDKAMGLARRVLFRATPTPISLRRQASWEPKRD
ncbi:hypothetical protein EXIGLDRAFT_760913 [Exidia glandulosa HHB12029]|uniref:Uncharacterized protein n=1 Tax=Exidia glandulosa HHB12029 TaxID=1314781 RepID=A0A165NZ20_EXIGL|nr:hypothetical protein EXIGLDRAFT_760913 [Exidia glandulosa HHB12029]